MRSSIATLTVLFGLSACQGSPPPDTRVLRADVVVYGSTPGGFCAAIAAAREGAPDSKVALFKVGSQLFPIVRTMRPVVGVAADLWEPWQEALGRKRRLVRETV